MSYISPAGVAAGKLSGAIILMALWNAIRIIAKGGAIILTVLQKVGTVLQEFYHTRWAPSNEKLGIARFLLGNRPYDPMKLIECYNDSDNF
jgi:hypothetical protein